MKTQKIIILVLLAIFAGTNLFANINVNVNLKRPLPPLFSTWRNDPTIVQITLSANQNYSQIRISFTITDLDKNKLVVKTKNDNPSMPRFNLSTGVPLFLTGNQIIKEDALDIDPSIRTWSTTTQMLPEGTYEFCVTILDINNNAITTTGVTCKSTTVTIPDPPVLISPIDGVGLEYSTMILPQFLWSPVANPPAGTIISYLLKLAPEFSGQNDRTALDNNTPLYNKLLQPGRISYQYMPSDIPFSRYPDAVAFVWQIQALDANNIPATRNDGKSEIGKFVINKPNSGTFGPNITLITPEKNGSVTKSHPDFKWTSNGKFTSYTLKIAKVPVGQQAQSAFENPQNQLLSKIVNDSVYTYSMDDPPMMDSSKDNPILGYVWQVSSNNNSKLSKTFSEPVKSEIWFFSRNMPKQQFYSETESNDINCNVSPPTVNTLSTKTYHKDNIVKLGEFQLTFLTEPVAGDSNKLKGDGYVTVPFLKNIRFAVNFTDIQINTNDEVVSGSAQVKMSDGFPVVPNIGLNDDQIKQYTDNASKLTQIQDFTLITLPIGIDNVVKSSPIVLAITSGVFTPNGAIIDAALKFSMPGLGDGADLCFGGKVCLKPDGFGDNKELYLSQDFVFPKAGDGWTFTFKHKMMSIKGTYVSFDKDGFHELNVSATVDFPRSWLVPAPDDNTSKVSFLFSTSYSSSKDLIADCTIPNFSPASLKDIEFDVESMTVDLSSAANPLSMTYPDSYSGDKSNNWQGFYISKAVLKLPAIFKSSTGQKLSGEIRNMIIDKSGFTGTASVLGLLDLNLGGFSASIDSFNTQFLNSSFTTGSIVGKLKLPISPDALKYNGTMAVNSGGSTYSFTVSTDSPKGLSVPMWLAKFNLEPTSSINITSSPAGFKAEALINASITIDSKIGPLPLKFEAMRVDGLKITQDGLQGGVFKLGSPQKSICGFDLNTADISLTSSGTNRFGIKFDIKSLGLFGDAFTGSTSFTIWAKRDGLLFSYDNYDLNKIKVGSDLIGGLIRLDGELDIYSGDSQFGDGFRANLSATILEEIKGDVTVQFGSKLKSNGNDKFKYWYLDASIVFEPGFMIAPGVGIYGFGGGAYYNMKPVSSASTVPSKSGTANPKVLGATSSGAKYEPSETPAIGFKAMVLFGIYPTSYPLNGNLSLDITLKQINNSWSVDQVTFNGQAFMCANVTNQNSNLANGTAMIKMDFSNKRFEGDFTLNINYLSFISGTANLNILADSKLKQWHVYVGTWTKKVGLTIAGLYSVDGYFMTGTDLPPGLPPFPSDVTEIFSECGKAIPTASQSDKTSFKNGNGISFGTSSSFGGDYSFLIFYAHLAAGMGYDLNLHNYPGMTCKNSSSLGINGWYALGQMYAYVAASIGIHVDVWFYEGDIEILSGGFAAILQGGIPNPTWGKGAVAGYYRVLKGLVKGHCSFEFSFGNQCEFETDNPLAIGLIADMEPVGGNVSPFISPSATFNFQIPDGNNDNSFDIQVNGSDGMPGPVRTFRIVLDEKSIYKGNSNNTFDVNEGITDEDMTLVLTPKSIIDGKTCRFKIRAHGEELKKGGWQFCTYEKDEDPRKGQQIKTDTTVYFTTGPSPAYVPDLNIMYSFPAMGQRYFIPDKGLLKTGYMVMRQEQGDLFDPDKFLDKFPEYKNQKDKLLVDYVADIRYDGNKKTEVPAFYQINPPRVEFDITSLATSKVYNVQIIARIKPKFNVSQMVGLTHLMQKITDRSNKKLYTPKGMYDSNSNGDDITKIDPAKLPKGNISYKDNNTGPKSGDKLKDLNNGKSDEPQVNFGNLSNLKKNEDAKISDNLAGKQNVSTKDDAKMAKKNNETYIEGIINSDAGKDYKKVEISADVNKKSYAQNGSKYASMIVAKHITNIDSSQSIIDTTSTKKIDVSAMKTLQPNEKSLFENDLYFRTSQFTSMTQKLNSINLQSKNIYWIFCSVILDLKEPFDNFDIKGQPYSTEGSNNTPNHVFGPFIKFVENENTDWLNMAKFAVYDVIDGNSHCGFDNGQDAPVPLPYWLNDRITGTVGCDQGDYEYPVVTGVFSKFNQETERWQRINNNTMIQSYWQDPFKSLNEAVSFVPNQTQSQINYNAEWAYSDDIYKLLGRITDYAIYLKNVMYYGWNDQAYSCLWVNCIAQKGIGNQQGASDLYFYDLGMTHDNADMTYKVVWYLWDNLDNNYLPSDKQKMFGNISFFIKGWYPPGPNVYHPDNISNWNFRGQKTISFDVQ